MIPHHARTACNDRYRCYSLRSQRSFLSQLPPVLVYCTSGQHSHGQQRDTKHCRAARAILIFSRAKCTPPQKLLPTHCFKKEHPNYHAATNTKPDFSELAEPVETKASTSQPSRHATCGLGLATRTAKPLGLFVSMAERTTTRDAPILDRHHVVGATVMRWRGSSSFS